MKIILDVKLKGQHVSVESFLAAYKLTRNMVVKEVSDVVAEEFKFVTGASKKRLQKYFQENLVFEVKESRVGSYEIIAICAPIAYLVGKAFGKFLFEIIKDNEDFKDLKSLINERLSEKIFKRLRRRFEVRESENEKISAEMHGKDLLKITMTQDKSKGKQLLTESDVDKAIAEMDENIRSMRKGRE
jgi:hypothetical protein